ncbi:ASCH domain-containing protein [Spirosoma humi]
MNQLILLSIKPEFVEQIFNGKKTIELRKCKPDARLNDIIIVYCTKPVKAIVGMCRISEILDLSPNCVWEKYSTQLGITEDQFWDYYKDSNRSIGIRMKDVCLFKESIRLSEIKGVEPNFSPPQTFKYFSRSKFLNIYKKYKKSKID